MNVHPFLDTLKRAFKLGESNILMGGSAGNEQDAPADYDDVPRESAPAAAQNYHEMQYRQPAYPGQPYPQAAYAQAPYQPQMQYGQQTPYQQTAPYQPQAQYGQQTPYQQTAPYQPQAQYGQQTPYQQTAPYQPQAQYGQQTPYQQPAYPQTAENEEEQPQGGFRSQFTMQQEYEAQEEQQPERRVFGRRSARREEAQQPAAPEEEPVPFTAAPAPAPSQDIYIVHVAGMEDCRRAMTALRKGHSVFVALDQIDNPADSRRMLDTLLGAAYALDSGLVRVSAKWSMFILTPAGVTVHASNNAFPAQSAPQTPSFAAQETAQSPYYPAQDPRQSGYRPADPSYGYPAV